MKIAGDHRLELARDLVWQAVLDPAVLQRTLPGCENLETIGENEYRGVLRIKVGPVQGVFEGTVKLLDLDPPNGYRLSLQGKGAPGFVTCEGTVALRPDGAATVLRYDIDAQVGGRIAAVGQRLLDSSAKVIARQALEGLGREIAARAASATLAAAAEGPAPGTAGAGLVTPPPTPAAGAPSQGALARELVTGVVGDLVPKPLRPVLIVGAVLLVLAIVAIVLRGGGA